MPYAAILLCPHYLMLSMHGCNRPTFANSSKVMKPSLFVSITCSSNHTAGC